MGASRFVGRVGGLAMALGVGAAVFTGYGVAWADGSPSSDAGPKASQPARAGCVRNRDEATRRRTKVGGSPRNAAASSESTVDTGGAERHGPRPRPRPRPQCRALSPRRPPLRWTRRPEAARRCRSIPRSALALAAFTRREASSAASTTNPAASVTTSANLSANSAITTTPTVTWSNGVLIGSVNAVCASCGSAPLTYTVISAPNAGGKVNFNIGPTGGTDPACRPIQLPALRHHLVRPRGDRAVQDPGQLDDRIVTDPGGHPAAGIGGHAGRPAAVPGAGAEHPAGADHRRTRRSRTSMRTRTAWRIRQGNIRRRSPTR